MSGQKPMPWLEQQLYMVNMGLQTWHSRVPFSHMVIIHAALKIILKLAHENGVGGWVGGLTY